jgi:hypothetical protein
MNLDLRRKGAREAQNMADNRRGEGAVYEDQLHEDQAPLTRIRMVNVLPSHFLLVISGKYWTGDFVIRVRSLR